MNKQAGVLLPVASFPGKYGIGDFGSSLKEGIDIIANMKFKSLQILPLNPLGYGNSPYQSFSSYAIDSIYVDLENLVELSLIDKVDEEVESTSKINYDEARLLKNKYLKEAYAKFKETGKLQSEYVLFLEENEWVEDYAKFMAIKRLYPEQIWFDLEAKYTDYANLNLNFKAMDYDYFKFEQYILFKQWNEIKHYANAKDIKIIGDIPIYVSVDSQDVWSNRENYLLDADGRPTHVAGVPPDYFSEDGQLWGNPLYDWEHLKTNKFKFWMDRLAHNRKMFDVIRIDHFRAFDTYWKIKYGEPTARNGEWIEAPGHELFEEIFKKLTNEEIVVEDLGDLRPEVHQLRDDFGLKGMKIIQFALDPNETNNDFDDKENMLLYTGTHDNQTLVGWYNDLSETEKANLVKQYGEQPVKQIIANMFASVSEIVVIPVQDMLLMDDSARINTPGTVNDINWTWKLTDFDALRTKEKEFKQLILANNR